MCVHFPAVRAPLGFHPLSYEEDITLSMSWLCVLSILLVFRPSTQELENGSTQEMENESTQELESGNIHFFICWSFVKRKETFIEVHTFPFPVCFPCIQDNGTLINRWEEAKEDYSGCWQYHGSYHLKDWMDIVWSRSELITELCVTRQQGGGDKGSLFKGLTEACCGRATWVGRLAMWNWEGLWLATAEPHCLKWSKQTWRQGWEGTEGLEEGGYKRAWDQGEVRFWSQTFLVLSHWGPWMTEHNAVTMAPQWSPGTLLYSTQGMVASNTLPGTLLGLCYCNFHHKGR